MRIQVVSPWYPDRYSPYSGVFVKKQVDALRLAGHEVEVEQPDIFPAPTGDIPDEVWDAVRALAAHDVASAFPQEVDSVRIPSPVPSRSGQIGRAVAFEAAIRAKREFLPNDMDVTHAHLGIPTGLALLELGDSPLVVTEHQSTLGRVFAEPGGVAAYQRVVDSADVFICVSNHLKVQVAAAIGDPAADKIVIVPNVVDLEDIRFRKREGGRTTNWIYVGTVAAHKGIELLLKSFKAYRDVDPESTLTIVGDGPHLAWVERFSSGGGFRSAIKTTGSMPHQAIGTYLDEADIMVHLSEGETFGIASLEGIGAGLPVVSLMNGGAESAWGDIEPAVGRLIPSDSAPEDVLRAVLELRDSSSTLDPELGRSEVESRFVGEVVASKLAGLYKAAL